MTYCSVVAVLALVGSPKKRFGHYAFLKVLSLRSLSIHYPTTTDIATVVQAVLEIFNLIYPLGEMFDFFIEKQCFQFTKNF